MFGSIQRLLSAEDFKKIPKKRRVKIRNEVYLCRECGHLYYYRIIKCPLCESRDTVIMNNNKASKDVVP